MKGSLALLAFAACFVLAAAHAEAETWNLATGGSWNSAANWSPASIPNATGASAIFNGAMTANNPDQTANRTITLDALQTVGSILFNNDLGAFTNSITTGTGTPPSLIFNNGGSGATITTTGSGTGNNTMTASFRLDDNLTAFVNNTTATSAAGSLNITAVVTGTGGFTKEGPGLATYGTGAKTYTGATAINGGRMRISVSAQPSATSSFTINAGGQVDLISAGTYTFGSGPLNLNGNGATSLPFSAFPGAIRPDSNLAITIANAVNLQSAAVVHMQGSATGVLTFTGAVSGTGGLIAGSALHDANIGQIVLNGSPNTYSGGTTVNAGALVAGATSTTAFGTGNVSVVSANAVFAGSIAKISVLGGATNAIADSATLSLAGGNAGGIADDGYIDLAAGINETVGGLVLGGATQTLTGTYGSIASGATFQFDEYFAGTGLITLAAPAGVPGDYNNNGSVDAGDYVVWRKPNPTLFNDPTPGNQPADYDFWRARFGKPPGSGSGLSGSAVPEPGTFALCGLLVTCVAASRRSRIGRKN